MKMRKLAIGATAAVAISAAGVAGGIALADGEPDRPSADKKDEPPIVVAEGLELLSSATATDWVTYASTVAVVTVVGEHVGDIPADDRERGEGTINRDVDLRIDESLWTRGGVQVPSQVTIGTTGWSWSDGNPEERIRFINAGRPWYEVGQQYLVALAQWPGTPVDQLASCEDEPEAGGWGPIGEYAATPVTDGVIGVGELEGTERSLEDALQAAKSAEETVVVEGGSLRGHLAGQTVETVVPMLKAAAAIARPKDIPAPSC